MTPERFKMILAELMDENPFAVRAVLRLLDVVFTDEVPTLAVTAQDKPRLLVNLEFIAKNCRTDDEVKAVILHEFLHVVLRHTEFRGKMTWSRHLATDAVINAMIHRMCGPRYSSLMARYYEDAQGPVRLLRPMTEAERKSITHWRRVVGLRYDPLARPWRAIYEGSLTFEDIKEIADDLWNEKGGAFESGSVGSQASEGSASVVFLGNHQDMDKPLPTELIKAVLQSGRGDNAVRELRAGKGRGAGKDRETVEVERSYVQSIDWRRETLRILKSHLETDARALSTLPEEYQYHVPVLSSGDRRAFLHTMWSPFLPDAVWDGVQPRGKGTAQVYLDASASMNSTMPDLIALLWNLSRYIRRPFWAFSTEVVPARIRNGRLITASTGGTSMTCVLEHVLKTGPSAAVVVTDGYIEELAPSLVRSTSKTRLHVIVTPDGSSEVLEHAGIPFNQLKSP